MPLEQMRLLRKSIERAANLLYLSQSAGTDHREQQSYLLEAVEALGGANRHLCVLLKKLEIPATDVGGTTAPEAARRKNLFIAK